MAGGNEIGVGLIGYGLAGRLFHAPYIDAVPGLRITAIATSSPDRRALAAAEHPDATAVETADELVERGDVRVVVVVTPNRFHAPLALRALAAGRDVVVDKPIAMDIDEADMMLEAAARSGRLLTVYQNRRFDGDFVTVQRLIAGGALGAIDSLEARFERWSPVGDEWREQAAEAGGPLRDLGAHLIDQSLLLFGPVRRVWAEADRRRADSQVDDAVFVTLDHVAGVRSRLWTSLVASRPGPRLRVRGLSGEYIKDDLDPQENQLLAGLRPGADGFGEDPPERWGRLFATDGTSTAIPTERGDYSRFYELLRDALLGLGPAPVDPTDSLESLRIIEWAEEAARTGAVRTAGPP